MDTTLCQSAIQAGMPGRRRCCAHVDGAIWSCTRDPHKSRSITRDPSPSARKMRAHAGGGQAMRPASTESRRGSKLGTSARRAWIAHAIRTASSVAWRQSRYCSFEWAELAVGRKFRRVLWRWGTRLLHACARLKTLLRVVVQGEEQSLLILQNVPTAPLPTDTAWRLGFESTPSGR
jgi:hypothetical protein